MREHTIIRVTTPRYELPVCISCRTILNADEVDGRCRSKAFLPRTEDYWRAGIDIEHHLRKVGLE